MWDIKRRAWKTKSAALIMIIGLTFFALVIGMWITR